MQAAHRRHFFPACSEGMVEGTRSGKRSRTSDREQHIEQSKVHWSQLSEPLDCRKPLRLFKLVQAWLGGKGRVEMGNVRVFKALQSHPTWGYFFNTFGYSLGVCRSLGELEVGEKFAEGGQAELFHAHVTWAHRRMNEVDEEDGVVWVLKVFKKGTLLQHLQGQWPH